MSLSWVNGESKIFTFNSALKVVLRNYRSVVRMSPASQQQPSQGSLWQRESHDGSPQAVTLKICECFFEEEKEGPGGDVEVILGEEKESAAGDSGSLETETNDDECEEEREHVEDNEESERLSLVNETGSCSGEEEEGGGLIDKDDSIYQVQFPTSFVELNESAQTELTESQRNEKNEKVEAWLNNEPSLKKQRKGILRRNSQLDDDIFQLRPSLSGSDESFTRKIHPKYASLNVVRDFLSPGETREGDLSGSSGGKRKRVSLLEEEEENLIVPHKRCRAVSPAQQGWLDFLPGWVSGFFR